MYQIALKEKAFMDAFLDFYILAAKIAFAVLLTIAPWVIIAMSPPLVFIVFLLIWLIISSRRMNANYKAYIKAYDKRIAASSTSATNGQRKRWKASVGPSNPLNPRSRR